MNKRTPAKATIIAHHILKTALEEAADAGMDRVSDAVWLGGEIVVEGKAMPFGPMRTVSVPSTRVVGVAPLPIRYVVPEMLTSPGSTENVKESAVTTKGVIVAKGGMVLLGSITPSGPTVTTSPPIFKVVELAPTPIW